MMGGERLRGFAGRQMHLEKVEKQEGRQEGRKERTINRVGGSLSWPCVVAVRCHEETLIRHNR